jgi:riboflavin biosynthesis pyrimidine reductase
LRERVVDRLLAIATPRLLGGDARAMLGPLSVARLADAPAVTGLAVRRIGPDLVLDGAMQY